MQISSKDLVSSVIAGIVCALIVLGYQLRVETQVITSRDCSPLSGDAYYITGGTVIHEDGSTESRDSQDPLIACGTSRLDAISRSGITVWSRQEWESGSMWRIMREMRAVRRP